MSWAYHRKRGNSSDSWTAFFHVSAGQSAAPNLRSSQKHTGQARPFPTQNMFYQFGSNIQEAEPLKQTETKQNHIRPASERAMKAKGYKAKSSQPSIQKSDKAESSQPSIKNSHGRQRKTKQNHLSPWETKEAKGRNGDRSEIILPPRIVAIARIENPSLAVLFGEENKV